MKRANFYQRVAMHGQVKKLAYLLRAAANMKDATFEEMALALIANGVRVKEEKERRHGR